MVMMMPSTAATMPRPGRASLVVRIRRDRDVRLLVVRLELVVEQQVELLGRGGAVDDLLERVAEEVDRVVVLQERRVLAEDRALLHVVDVLVERDRAVLADEREHLVLQLQQLQVVVVGRHLGRERRLEGAEHLVAHLAGRRDDQRAERGAADDDELVGLPEDGEVAARHGEPAEDRGEDDDEADDGEHGQPLIGTHRAEDEAFSPSRRAPARRRRLSRAAAARARAERTSARQRAASALHLVDEAAGGVAGVIADRAHQLALPLARRTSRAPPCARSRPSRQGCRPRGEGS